MLGKQNRTEVQGGGGRGEKGKRGLCGRGRGRGRCAGEGGVREGAGLFG